MDKPSTSKVDEKAEAAGGAARIDDDDPYRHLDSTLLLPDKINDVLVRVSAVLDPGLFYIILPFGGKTYNELNLCLLSSTRALVVDPKAGPVLKAVNEHYSNLRYHVEKFDLVIGSIVVAKLEGKWYRGKVQKNFAVLGLAKIFFVDVGCDDYVHHSQIRPIHEKFLKDPFQAVPCSLLGVQPSGAKGSGWSSSATELFKNLVVDEVLLAETVQREGDVFQLSLRRTKDYRDVARQLISLGYAQFKSKKVKGQKKKK